MWARSSIPEWSTHEIECRAMNLDDSETTEYTAVRLLQRILKLEKAVDSMIFPNQDQ